MQATHNGFVSHVRRTVGQQPTILPHAAPPGKNNMPIELKDLSPKPARGNLRELNFEPSCDASQRKLVKKSFEEALILIDNVLKTSSKDSVPFRTFMDFYQGGEGAKKQSGKGSKQQLDGGAKQLGNDGGVGGSAFAAVIEVFGQMMDLITTNEKTLKITCDKADKGCEVEYVP